MRVRFEGKDCCVIGLEVGLGLFEVVVWVMVFFDFGDLCEYWDGCLYYVVGEVVLFYVYGVVV